MGPQNSHEISKFDGIIRPLKQEDSIPLKIILESWVRDSETGELIPEEVEQDLQEMTASLNNQNEREYFVAETAAGRVVGMIGLSPLKEPLRKFSNTDSPSELINAYVDQDFRGGKGIGTALVNKLVERASQKGSNEILLDSGPRYEQSGWGFYDKLPGFERVGVVENLYGPGRNSQVWRKLLT